MCLSSWTFQNFFLLPGDGEGGVRGAEGRGQGDRFFIENPWGGGGLQEEEEEGGPMGPGECLGGILGEGG